MSSRHPIDRHKWPPGPWDGEPDRWEGRRHGMPLLAVRNDGGAWCGYVGILPGHPWHGGGIPDEIVESINVHAGITYGPAECQEGGDICHVPAAGEPDDVRWLGFDTSHAGDLQPTSPDFAHFGYVYRDLQYIRGQVEGLADQIQAAGDAESSK